MKKEYTTIIIEKELKKEMDLVLRRLGLRTYRELFEKIIEKTLKGQ